MVWKNLEGSLQYIREGFSSDRSLSDDSAD